MRKYLQVPRRLLRSGLCVLPWVVLSLILAMGLRSCVYEDSIVCVTSKQKAYMATSTGGKIFFQKNEGAFVYPHTDIQSIRVTDGQAGFVSWGDESPTVLGFAVRTEQFQLPPLANVMLPGEVNIIMPYWLLLVLCGIWPATLIARRVRARRQPAAFPVT